MVRAHIHTHTHTHTQRGILVTLEKRNPGIYDIMDGSKRYYTKLNKAEVERFYEGL